MDEPCYPDEQNAIEAAALWYARLLPGAVGLVDAENEQEAFARWLAADPEHARAWDIVQTMGQRMAQVPADIALSTLQRQRRSRRQTLQVLGMAVIGAGVLTGLCQKPWEQADHATATGQRSRLTLADGSLLDLDTQTTLDVDYGADERAIRLRAGTILVSTRPDTTDTARPFVVYTAHSRILALGTRFEVRAEDEGTTVSVLEDAVLVHRAGTVGVSTRVQAGERLHLTRLQQESIVPNPMGVGAWTSGQLLVQDRPLSEVIVALARYRRGWLTCDPAVAGLRISGVLPIDDTDQALAALEESFALRVERQWAGWRTRIGPR